MVGGEVACSGGVEGGRRGDGPEQYAIQAFADALDDVPMALAENSGLSRCQLTAIASTSGANSFLGVDASAGLNMKRRRSSRR